MSADEWWIVKRNPRYRYWDQHFFKLEEARKHLNGKSRPGAALWPGRVNRPPGQAYQLDLRFRWTRSRWVTNGRRSWIKVYYTVLRSPYLLGGGVSSGRPGDVRGCYKRWIEGWGWGWFARPYPDGAAGITAPPWRIGLWAPRQWAAEPPGLRPYGLREYEKQHRKAVASLIAAPQITETQHIRDLRDQIYDTEIRQKFGDTRNVRHWHRRRAGGLWLLSPRFARGVRLAEIEGINALRQIKVNGCYNPASEHAAGFIDGTYSNDEASRDGSITEKASTGFGYQDVTAEIEGPDGTIRALETSPGRWDVYHKGRRILEGSPRPLADAKQELQRDGINSGEVRLIIVHERQKPGRKPIGERAQTGAERKRKYDAKRQIAKRARKLCAKLKTPAPHRRNETGVVGSLPLEPVAPVALFEDDNDRDNRSQANRIEEVDT